MVWLLYNALLTLLMPIWLPWTWFRARRRKEQPNWDERFGNFAIQPSSKRRIWFHTVSVGEFVAAKPILKELRVALPEHEIVVTVTTSSGHQTARESEAGLFDRLFYFPLDSARFQLAAMQRVQPEVVAVMETELWMNFLWAAKVFSARTVLVNGRISDGSFPRARRIGFYYRRLLADLDRALMQTEEDAARIESLGAKSAEILGNCKFDQANEAAADPMEWRAKLGITGDKPVVVVGSTRGELEEAMVIEAIRLAGLDRATVIHAPRHLERAPALAEAAKSAFGSVALRSLGEAGPYIVLDTYGELGSIYSLADIAIIGGGFANLGGQNLFQPLAQGKPVLHGPHMQNFRDVAQAADSVGAARICSTADELAAALTDLLDHPDLRESMGSAARQLVEQNLGASRRYAAAIAEEATKFTPSPRRSPH
jgi:3-deoxy-D-manno-octulosonic-acid transferase